MSTKEILDAIVADSAHLSPEIYLTSFLVVLLTVTPFLKKFIAQFGGVIMLIGFVALGCMYVAQFNALTEPIQLYSGMLLLDKQAMFFKFLVLAGAFAYYCYYLAINREEDDEQVGEYHFMILSTILGLNLVVMSQNLLMAFVSLEIISIASYSLVLFGENEDRPEAGIKYIIFGALGTSIMLFGASIIYALNGSLDFSVLFNTMGQEGKDYSMIVSIFSGMFMVGGLFKLTVFPFHVWVPDVYKSIPVKLATFFSYGPKIAGLALVLNVLDVVVEPHQQQALALFLGVVLLATIFVGNLSALWSQNAKRLMAYSSITQSGYLLVGLFAYSTQGVEAVMYYSIAYLFLNFSGFYLVEMLIKITGSEQIKSFAGLGLKYPFWGILVVLVMIGLTGLPPTIGFMGKIYAFIAVWNHPSFGGDNSIYLSVLILGLLNVAIALFYYLKIPFYMFFRKSNEEQQMNTLTIYQKTLALAFSLPVLVLFFFNDYIFGLIHLFN